MNGSTPKKFPHPAVVFLFICTTSTAAIIVGYALYNGLDHYDIDEAEFLFITIVVALTLFIYPVLGAVATVISIQLFQWAFENKNDWGIDERFAFGSVWPLGFIVCIIITFFIGVLRRLYDLLLKP